jgi:hypothetical protein
MAALAGLWKFTVYSEGDTVCMDVDSSNPDPKYWERVLSKCGLSMNRGKHLKTKTSHGLENRDLILVGSAAELDGVVAKQEQKNLGKVSPTGKGPDE